VRITQVAGVRRITLSDFDELPDALPGRVTAASPLRGGPFSMAVTGIDVGDVVLRIGRNTPLLVQGEVPDDMAWVALPFRSCGALLLNGRPSIPHALAVYGAGAMHEAATHGEATWALMALRTTVLERLLDLPARSPISRPGAHGMLVCDPAAWLRAASLLQAAADVAATDPEVFEVEEAQRALRASLLEISQELLAGPWGGERSRLLRSLPGRQTVVRAAEEYLRDDPRGAVTTVDLAAALGVSASRLRHAIRSTFGIGPQRYLRLRRLTLLRRALRTAGPDGPLPREAALAHGFWDLDRLACEYREIFSEDLEGLSRRGDEAQSLAAR
jgi:AraC family ethanolamine operon transcriptional activator